MFMVFLLLASGRNNSVTSNLISALFIPFGILGLEMFHFELLISPCAPVFLSLEHILGRVNMASWWECIGIGMQLPLTLFRFLELYSCLYFYFLFYIYFIDSARGIR